jgi:hypothetical protein
MLKHKLLPNRENVTLLLISSCRAILVVKKLDYGVIAMKVDAGSIGVTVCGVVTAVLIALLVVFVSQVTGLQIYTFSVLSYWGSLQLISLALGAQDGVAYAVHAGSFAIGAIGAIIWTTSYPFANEKLEAFNSISFGDAKLEG